MPRQSPYVIDLSSHERDTLEGRGRRDTLPYFEVLRAKMMLLTAEGWANDEIAAALSMGRDVVSLWRKRFCAERLPGLEGRPRGFPPEVVVQVMTQPPYRDARRVFWILDNGSSHRGAPCVRRLQAAYPNLVPVHGPVHARWLNQIEIYFSIVQRKVLTPNDFTSLTEVEACQPGVQEYYQSISKPFAWHLSRGLAEGARVGAHPLMSGGVREYIAEFMNRPA